MRLERDSLLLFVRFPEPGRVKTRLVPRLGAEGAARLYRRMAEVVAGEARLLQRAGLVRTALVEPPGRLAEVARWLGEGFQALPQAEGDLGRRLAAGFAGAFEQGASRAVAIGTDCPDVSSDLLARAFDLLRSADAVLGPALDGGYYLIGLSRLLPDVFEGIPWSTSGVAEATLKRLRESRASVQILPTLRDIDTPEDLDALPRWSRLLGGSDDGGRESKVES